MDQNAALRRKPYAAHLESLDRACRWLAVGQGRAKRYSQLVREFFEEGKRSREHILCHNESCEIVDLYELWEANVDSFPGLRRKFTTVFKKGPLLREDENPTQSTNRPRNDAFGYLVAGRLLAAGVDVVAVDGIISRNVTCQSEADLTFAWDGTFIDIECKRPQTVAALRERSEEAREQIMCSSRGGRVGVIAIDCSAFVRPGGVLLKSVLGEATGRSIFGVLEKAVGAVVTPYLTDSIPGFILFARVPSMTRVGRSLIVSPQGEPIYQLRPDSISTWLVVGNSDYKGPDVLRSIFRRIRESARRAES